MRYEDRIKKYSELTNYTLENKQKIGLIIKGNYIASNYIRILSPFSNFSNTEYVPYLIDRPDFNKFKQDLENDNIYLDIIIVQRDALEWSLAKLLVDKCKLFGVKLIFEIDDDLINMDKTSPIYQDFLPRIKTMEFLAVNSDCVTVSTEILRERMLIYNNNVITIPNAITDYWKIEKNKPLLNNSDMIKIGYMGTITHTKDLKIIEEVIKNIKTKYNNKNIIFEVIEGTTDEIKGANIIRIPKSDEYYPNFVSWMQKNINWDIAIAPLIKEDPINLSKSELKYLEYTALNIPGVYSGVGPYEYAILHKQNGMIVKNNTIEEWENCLSELIENVQLREKIVLNAWEDIKKNYLITNMVNNWINVLNNNKRNKNSILYKKFIEYLDKNFQMSFNDFLIENSEKIIHESKLFDENYYLKKYPDVNYSGLSAVTHYLKFGLKENCYPNKKFNEQNYDNFNLIHNFNLDPFVYHILYKENNNTYFIQEIYYNCEINEKILKNNFFDNEFYLTQQPDVKKANMDPLYHYTNYGYKEHRNPNQYFSNRYYTETYLGDNRLWNPLTHYALIGKEKKYKTNPWDSPNKNYSTEKVLNIMQNLSKKVSILIPVFNYSSKVISCLKTIIKNTLGENEIIIFITSPLLKEYNNFDCFDEAKFKIILIENNDYLRTINDYMFNIRYTDVVLLNSYSEVTYNWLSRLIVKAYSSENIDLVSPISNFLGDIHSFSQTLEKNEFTYTPDGIDTILRKSSNFETIYSKVGDGFCIYIKNSALTKIKLNKMIAYNSNSKFCYFYIPNDITHVIDDSIYIHHDLSFFEENDNLFKDIEKKFLVNLDIHRFLKSSFQINFKNKFKNYLQDKTTIMLSNRILYIIDEIEFNYFLYFIGYYTTKYYDCYFLTSNNKEFKLWKNSQLLKTWPITIELTDHLKSEDFKEMYFNILYFLNINIVHIINFNHNSFDLFDIIDSLNINLIMNCTNDFYIHPLQRSICQNCHDSRHCLDKNLKKSCDIIKENFFEIINTHDLIIDKSFYSYYEPILENSNNIIKIVDYPKLYSNNDKILSYDYTQQEKISLLFIGNMTSDEITLIKNFKEQNSHENLELHFICEFYNTIDKIGTYHGLLNINTVENTMKNINPTFIVILDEFLEIYDIIYAAKITKNIVLLNSDKLIDLTKEYNHCMGFSFNSNIIYYEDIEKLKNSESYFNILKEFYYDDENLKNKSIYITRWFSYLYSKNRDDNPKEIIPKKLPIPNNKKIMQCSNFKEFLNNTYIYPLINTPFNKEEYKYISIMENIAKYLENKSVNNANKPLVSIIMPVYNREDIVETAINSILKQSYTNFELIIVDDGSVDNTINIIKNISDKRVKLIECEKNQGSSAARNIGLKHAIGKYICYLDSDNEWEYNYIDVVVGAFLELPDADAIYSGQLLYNNIGDELLAVRFGSLNESFLMNGNYIDLNCFAHKIEVYEEIGGFDESLKRLVDWDFILRTNNYFNLYSIPVLKSKYYFNAAKNRISDYSSKNQEDANVQRNLSRNVHLKNLINKKPEFNLNKSVNIIIYNIHSLDKLQDCIHNILSLNLKQITITIINDYNNKHVDSYINTLNNKININIVNNGLNSNIVAFIQEIFQFNQDCSDLLLLDSDAILLEGSLEYMQHYAYNLTDSGIIIPQHIIPDEMNQEKRFVQHSNQDIKCDITPTYFSENIIEIPIFNNGKIIELKLPPLFCAYLKYESFNIIQDINWKLENYNSVSEILSNYIRDIKQLKIYYVPDAIVYHNFKKKNWGN